MAETGFSPSPSWARSVIGAVAVASVAVGCGRPALVRAPMEAASGSAPSLQAAELDTPAVDDSAPLPNRTLVIVHDGILARCPGMADLRGKSLGMVDERAFAVFEALGRCFASDAFAQSPWLIDASPEVASFAARALPHLGIRGPRVALRVRIPVTTFAWRSEPDEPVLDVQLPSDRTTDDAKDPPLTLHVDPERLVGSVFTDSLDD
ncbi:MAG: hypothetical protein U0169_21680 [Polyangiaceae bacterium]